MTIWRLNTCPFCGVSPRAANIGHTPKSRDVVPEHWYWVYCGNCGARGPRGDTRDEARHEWNDREGG